MVEGLGVVLCYIGEEKLSDVHFIVRHNDLRAIGSYLNMLVGGVVWINAGCIGIL